MAHEARKPAEGVFIEAERLARLAGGGFASIGDDVCSHGGAEFAVALVDLLDSLLALFLGGQIEWPVVDGEKQAHAFGLKDDSPFAFARIWSVGRTRKPAKFSNPSRS